MNANLAPTLRNRNLKRKTLPRYPSFRKNNLGELTNQASEFAIFQDFYWKNRVRNSK